MKATWGCGVQSPRGSRGTFDDAAGPEASPRSDAPAQTKHQAWTV